jgi:hypothetical protein
MVDTKTSSEDFQEIVSRDPGTRALLRKTGIFGDPTSPSYEHRGFAMNNLGRDENKEQVKRMIESLNKSGKNIQTQAQATLDKAKEANAKKEEKREEKKAKV